MFEMCGATPWKGKEKQSKQAKQARAANSPPTRPAQGAVVLDTVQRITPPSLQSGKQKPAHLMGRRMALPLIIISNACTSRPMQKIENIKKKTREGPTTTHLMGRRMALSLKQLQLDFTESQTNNSNNSQPT